MESLVINQTTFAHITRLVFNASGRIYQVVVDQKFRYPNLRDIAVTLAREIELDLLSTVREIKRQVHENPELELSGREIAIIRQAISITTTVVSLFIFHLVRCIKRFLATINEIMGVSDLITLISTGSLGSDSPLRIEYLEDSPPLLLESKSPEISE